jgi:hypothetical protein
MSKQAYKHAIGRAKNKGAARAAIATNARKKLGAREFGRRAAAGRRAKRR